MRCFFLLLFIPFLASAEINESLQNLLLKMAKADQGIRKELGESGWGKAPQDLKDKVMRTDEKNTKKLKKILSGRSWFTEREVGKIGVAAAFLIVQHSPDIEFKEEMLPLLKQSYLNGEGVTGQEVALLTDRVRISKGQPQVYGTQTDISNREIIFKPIENREEVDDRRAEMGMPPLDFYKRLIEESYGIKDHPDIELN